MSSFELNFCAIPSDSGHTDVFGMDEDDEDAADLAPHLVPHWEDFDDDGSFVFVHARTLHFAAVPSTAQTRPCTHAHTHFVLVHALQVPLR